jgi:hypothetical protein
MTLEIIDDCIWDELLMRSPYKSIFQTSFWKNSVCRFLGGEARMAYYKKANLQWLLPLYFGKPWSAGCHIGSMGYGGPLPLFEMESVKGLETAFLEMVQYIEQTFACKCTGARTFPWQGWRSYPANQGTLTETEMIPLALTKEQTFEEVLTGNVRTAVRRSVQEGVNVKHLPQEYLRVAIELLHDTQARVGASYKTPIKFLEHLWNHPNVEFWSVFSKGGALTAMSVLLLYENTAFHLFHGWQKEEMPAGANQALIWEMVQSAIKRGCRFFNMGESHSASLKQAKQRWGTISYPILKLSMP